jgi:hypothetical protein
MKLQSTAASDVHFDPDETATARIAAPPPHVPELPPASRPAPTSEGPTKVYIGGVKIETNYSTKKVLDIVSSALTKPISTFLQTVADTASKLGDDKPLPNRARDAIKTYVDPIDAVVGALGLWAGAPPAQMVGGGVDAINKAVHGEPPVPGDIVGSIAQVVASVSTKSPSVSSNARQSTQKPLGNADKQGPSEAPTQTEAGVPGTTTNPNTDPDFDPPGRHDAAAQQRAKRIFGQLSGSGPINLEPASNADDGDERLKAFGDDFSFYRNDSDVNDMAEPVDGPDAASKGLRSVLTLGKGTQATSFSPEQKAYLGRAWVPGDGPSGLEGANIVKLGSGKDGVAAFRLRFKALAPGSTTIVTGGPMQGSTMLFAADQEGFYAYHAGASRLRPQWNVAEDGARSIVDAHWKMHGSALPASPAGAANNRNDLIAAAKEYPFSALIYDGDYPTEPGRTMPDQRINAPGHAVGADATGQPHGMMTFSYFEPNPALRTVGTAQAVITKDMKGNVVVSVLGERGKLDQMKTLSLHGGSVGFRYSAIGGATMSYQVRVQHKDGGAAA